MTTNHRRTFRVRLVGAQSIVSITAALALIGLPRTGIAQSSASTNPGAALVDQGIELRRAGNDSGALELFQRAYALERTPRTAAQVGLAEQALGRWSLAYGHLREALSNTQDPWIVRSAPALQQSLAIVERHLGTLEVLVAVEGAEIWINGERVGISPLREPLHVNTGSTAIEVRARGYASQHRTVDIDPGTFSRETFQLIAGRTDAINASTSSNPNDASTPTYVGPYVVMGIGVIGLLTGVALFVGRTVEVNGCTIGDNAIYCPTMDAYNHAQTAEGLNSAMPWAFAIGAVAVVGGAAWWLIHRLGHQSNERVVSFLAAPTDRGAWIGLGGNF